MSDPDGQPAGVDAVRLRGIAERCAGQDVFELAGGAFPVYLWLHGSTMVELTLRTDGSVDFQAILLLGPERPADVGPNLDRRNRAVPLGSFVVDDEGDIVYRHRIPRGRGRLAAEGDIAELCRIADRIDDELQAELGGERSFERFQSEVLDALGETLPREPPTRPVTEA